MRLNRANYLQVFRDKRFADAHFGVLQLAAHVLNLKVVIYPNLADNGVVVELVGNLGIVQAHLQEPLVVITLVIDQEVV